jgi:uncharacterized protein (DUF433 family)
MPNLRKVSNGGGSRGGYNKAMRQVPADPTGYVYETEFGGQRVVGTRVSIDSVVFHYWKGRSPEEIVELFPTLTPEKVHGALAYYLSNQAIVDQRIGEDDAEFDRRRREQEQNPDELRRRLIAARASRNAARVPTFVLCVRSEGEDDLTERKLYRVLRDQTASASAMIRVIDDSGEDYLYSVTLFVEIELEPDVEHILLNQLKSQ